jgi:hypothetical protein
VNVRRCSTRLAVLAGAAVLAVPVLAMPASAATSPPWEPDTNAVGTLTFYDSSGNVVTGGANSAHLFDFALASTDDPSAHPGFTSALLFANPTTGTTDTWSTHADESSSSSDPSAPGILGTSTHPLLEVDSAGANLQAAVSGFIPSQPSGWANVYQVRVYTLGGGGTGASKYWDADVQINNDGSWQEIYPVTGSSGTSTTTTLSASPTPGTQGQSTTVTATEVATDATHPSGSIEIDDGNQVLGTGSVDSSGQFSVMTSTLLPGTHSLSATFSSTASGYNGSTSATTHYLVNPVAATPKISGTVQAGKTVSCVEATTSGETAKYVWKAGSTTVGSSKTLTIPGSAVGKTLTCAATVNVSGGTASSATSAGKKVALGAALKAKKSPALSGPHKVGKKETVSAGTWSPKASSYSYQWLANGKAIKGATKSSLVLPRSVKGKKISCKVTAHAKGFASGSATTGAVKVS